MSGATDVSGFLRKDENGDFAMSAADTGVVYLANDRQVGINDKYIVTVLQAHSLMCGVIGSFNADEGAQWVVYKPDIVSSYSKLVFSLVVACHS